MVSTLHIAQVFSGQSNWTHNYCRNPDGNEEAPICFIESDVYDLCDVPSCDDVHRRREALVCIC